MDSLISMGSNLPEQTNIVMGFVNISGNTMVNCDINMDNVNNDDKIIFDEFLNMIGLHTTINLINTPKIFEVNIIIPMNIHLDIVDLDYNELSNDNRIVVDNFVEFMIKNISVI